MYKTRQDTHTRARVQHACARLAGGGAMMRILQYHDCKQARTQASERASERGAAHTEMQMAIYAYDNDMTSTTHTQEYTHARMMPIMRACSAIGAVHIHKYMGRCARVHTGHEGLAIQQCYSTHHRHGQHSHRQSMAGRASADQLHTAVTVTPAGNAGTVVWPSLHSHSHTQTHSHAAAHSRHRRAQWQ